MSSTNGYLVQHDDADRWLWARVLVDLPEVRELQDRGEQQHSGAGCLLRDLFAALFKAKPVLVSPRTVYQRKRHKLLATLMDSQDFRRLRLKTRLCEFEAAVAAADLYPKLLNAWPKEDPDPPGQPSAGTGSASGDQDDHALDNLLRLFVRQATEHTGQVQGQITAWGIDPGRVAQLPLREAAALAKRVQQSKTLQKIAKLAGRMKRLALNKHAVRVRHGTDELVAIEQGNALERVLPQELVALRHKALRTDFWRRYCERGLLQYQLSGRETLGQGPVVVCLDSSGSMQGSREVWAKAVTLGLLSVVSQEKRDFALIQFGSASECRVFRFDRGQGSPDQVVDALGFAFHGGTDFERPLREALTLIEASPYQKADVVFVTDGACRVSSDFLTDFMAAKQRRQFRVFSILIDLRQRLGRETTLEGFSDEVFRLTDLAQDQALLAGLFGR